MVWNQKRLIAIASGQEKGVVAAFTRAATRVLSWGYRMEVGRRNRRFDRDPERVVTVEIPVISIGNLTTGGTGKTPAVCKVAKMLRDRDQRVAIVSRGYGRGESGSNDEAMELDQRLPDVPHVQDPDRVLAATIAIEELEAQVILMDDGMQHRRLGRDLEITLIDATCPFGYGFVLPRGLLREPLSGLRRADLVIITRSDQVNENQLLEIETTIRRHHASVPVLRARHQPSRLRCWSETYEPIESLQGQDVAILSAVGNPSAFRKTVQQCGATVVSENNFPDHHQFDADAMSRIRQWVDEYPSIQRIVCTHKDLVKLCTDQIAGRTLWAIEIGMTIEDEDGILEQKLDSLLCKS